ncbi:ectD [Symbiodinium sp. CCMP2592]|nr:ectD [Symbiodinium sp. CCMP2592]
MQHCSHATKIGLEVQPSVLSAPVCLAMEVQWAVQLLTVVLTLLVVLVVRDIQAWLSGPTAQPSNVQTATLAPGSTEDSSKDSSPSHPPQEGGAAKDAPTPDALAGTKAGAGGDDPLQAGAKSADAADTPQKETEKPKDAATSDKDGTTAPLAKDSKDAADTAQDPAKKAVSPETMMQELTACHTTVKNFAANMSRLLNGITSVAPNLTKVQAELESSRKAAHSLETAVEKSISRMDKTKELPDEIKELTKRVGGLESIVGAVTAKMGTMSTNVDTFGKSHDSQLKDVLKGVAAAASSAKQCNSDVTAHVTAKAGNLESGLKEVLRKITATDYDSHTSMTATVKDVSNLGQELLAALNFLQGEAAVQKDAIYQLATVMADVAEQVRVIRDYCERPVPVAMAGHQERPPMPPPAYEPNLQQGPRQLNLNTALPVARAAHPQVRIEMGNGRSVNIPLS